jgi:hypothetical protein
MKKKIIFILLYSLWALNSYSQIWLTLTRPGTHDTIKIEAAKHGHAQVEIGESIPLHLSELGIEGNYTIIKKDEQIIADSSFVQTAEGKKELRAIIGKFKRYGAEVWDYTFSNSTLPIGSTPNHPFYSLDRSAYVPIGDMRLGERLQTYDGSPCSLVSKSKRPTGDFVYNLEIEGEHNYWVGSPQAAGAKDMMLVHNTYIEIKKPDGSLDYWVNVKEEKLANGGYKFSFKKGAIQNTTNDDLKLKAIYKKADKSLSITFQGGIDMSNNNKLVSELLRYMEEFLISKGLQSETRSIILTTDNILYQAISFDPIMFFEFSDYERKMNYLASGFHQHLQNENNIISFYRDPISLNIIAIYKNLSGEGHISIPISLNSGNSTLFFKERTTTTGLEIENVRIGSAFGSSTPVDINIKVKKSSLAHEQIMSFSLDTKLETSEQFDKIGSIIKSITDYNFPAEPFKIRKIQFDYPKTYDGSAFVSFIGDNLNLQLFNQSTDLTHVRYEFILFNDQLPGQKILKSGLEYSARRSGSKIIIDNLKIVDTRNCVLCDLVLDNQIIEVTKYMDELKIKSTLDNSLVGVNRESISFENVVVILNQDFQWDLNNFNKIIFTLGRTDQLEKLSTLNLTVYNNYYNNIKIIDGYMPNYRLSNPTLKQFHFERNTLNIQVFRYDEELGRVTANNIPVTQSDNLPTNGFNSNDILHITQLGETFTGSNANAYSKQILGIMAEEGLDYLKVEIATDTRLKHLFASYPWDRIKRNEILKNEIIGNINSTNWELSSYIRSNELNVNEVKYNTADKVIVEIAPKGNMNTLIANINRDMQFPPTKNISVITGVDNYNDKEFKRLRRLGLSFYKSKSLKYLNHNINTIAEYKNAFDEAKAKGIKEILMIHNGGGGIVDYNGLSLNDLVTVCGIQPDIERVYFAACKQYSNQMLELQTKLFPNADIYFSTEVNEVDNLKIVLTYDFESPSDWFVLQADKTIKKLILKEKNNFIWELPLLPRE